MTAGRSRKAAVACGPAPAPLPGTSGTGHLAPERCLNAGGVEAVPEESDTAPAFVRELIRDDEIILLAIRPSPLFIVLAPATGVLFLMVIALVAAQLAALVPWLPWTETQAYLLGFLLIAGRLGWQTLDWFNRVYLLTDRRILTRSGVLRVRIFETSLRSIQHTVIWRRVRERAFNLGTLGFATSGSDTFETFWQMLRQPVLIHRTVQDAIRRYGRPR